MFGSQVRGDATDESDIDIVVLLGDSDYETVGAVCRIVGRLEYDYEDKVFEPEIFVIYERTFDYRQKSDYNFTYTPDAETVNKLLADAKLFVKKVRKII